MTRDRKAHNPTRHETKRLESKIWGPNLSSDNYGDKYPAAKTANLAQRSGTRTHELDPKHPNSSGDIKHSPNTANATKNGPHDGTKMREFGEIKKARNGRRALGIRQNARWDRVSGDAKIWGPTRSTKTAGTSALKSQQV
jgi:hypothetical protein